MKVEDLWHWKIENCFGPVYQASKCLQAKLSLLFVCLFSELVSALVWVLPQPSSEHPEHGRERSGPSRQGAAAAPGGLWHHLTGNLSHPQLNLMDRKGCTSYPTGCPGIPMWPHVSALLTFTHFIVCLCYSCMCGPCWRRCSQRFWLVMSGSDSLTRSSPTILHSCSWPAWPTSPAAASLSFCAPRNRTLR